MRELCIITDHKPLMAILNKDMAMLSLYFSVFCYEYTDKGCTLYAGLVQTYKLQIGYPIATPQKTKAGIAGMSINSSAISTSVNMPVCTSIEDIQPAT